MIALAAPSTSKTLLTSKEWTDLLHPLQITHPYGWPGCPNNPLQYRYSFYEERITLSEFITRLKAGGWVDLDTNQARCLLRQDGIVYSLPSQSGINEPIYDGRTLRAILSFVVMAAVIFNFSWVLRDLYIALH